MMSPKEFAALAELLERTPMTAPERLWTEGLMRRFAAAVEEALRAYQEAQQATTSPSTPQEPQAPTGANEDSEQVDGTDNEPSRP